MGRRDGEWLLPYDAVRSAADPDAELPCFLESTCRAAADLDGWDRSLECEVGAPGRPTPLPTRRAFRGPNSEGGPGRRREKRRRLGAM